MKWSTLILLLSSTVLFTACPPSNSSRQTIKKIQNNKMNLPELVKETYGGLTFDISKLFEDYYSTEFCLSSSADCYFIPDIDLYFSIEKVEEKSINAMRFYNDDTTKDPTYSLQKFYGIFRAESLYNGAVSEITPIPASYKIPGYMQTVDGNPSNYSEGQMYFMASFKISGEYFMIQMIGRKENMAYLYDDFQRIIKSIH